MSPWVIAVVAGLLVALIQYGWREPRASWQVGGPALLRAGAVALVVALLMDAPASRARLARPWVALDVSASMARDDSALWRAARDTVRVLHADSVLAFGDSARPGDTISSPGDLSSALRPAVERALGAGHPLVVVTDAEVDDPDAANSLPPGSRIVVLARSARPDLAVVSLDAPRAMVSGDTGDVRIDLAAGAGGSRSGTVTLTLDGKTVATAPVESLPPYGERTITVHARLEANAGASVLRAVAASAGDVEARNDTLSLAIEISRAAAAVFVSTAPDFDARYALSVLRGALAIPTRGFYRVAPGQWRAEGPLTPVSESDVRQAVRDAPVVILHGDTAAFGPPRQATAAPLALVLSSSMEGEWYASDAPASPLAPALSGLVWDSLPPIGLAPSPPKGEWTALEARRGRGAELKPVVVGTDAPRRVVIVAASDLWRWRFRGGVSSDAFTALWGSIFDWLAAERADRRAAVPDERLLRAGDPVRWRRGSPNDSVVGVTLRRRGDTRVDSMTLRFAGGVSVVQSRPLPPGLYDVATRGGTALLAVNPSREWVPRAPALRNGAVRGAAAAQSGPRLRDAGWAYALIILLLCLEWLWRRRRGMR